MFYLNMLSSSMLRASQSFYQLPPGQARPRMVPTEILASEGAPGVPLWIVDAVRVPRCTFHLGDPGAMKQNGKTVKKRKKERTSRGVNKSTTNNTSHKERGERRGRRNIVRPRKAQTARSGAKEDSQAQERNAEPSDSTLRIE